MLKHKFFIIGDVIDTSKPVGSVSETNEDIDNDADKSTIQQESGKED